jgi:SAM-dependent methyltransferase
MPCKRYIVQNLEKQTFPDGSFDIVISQDVFEHIFDPYSAISEIERTLKPGGAYFMSVPVVRREQPSRRRSILEGGVVKHLLPPEYHGNPLGGGSLVTIDWGYDIVCHLADHTSMSIIMVEIDDIEQGIRDEWGKIIVAMKSDLKMI